MSNLLMSYELLDYNNDMIKESKEKFGKVRLKGIMQKADALNQNGRVYPRDILEREVRNYQKFIVENRALGEADHPESSVVNIKNVSHIVKECYMDDRGVVYGTIELLDTPSGKIIQSLVEAGVKLGISSRGIGSTKKQGDHVIVQEDFQLICFDMVTEPSTTQAFMLPEGRRLGAAPQNLELTRSDKIDRVMNDIITVKRRK
jgi:hypothetical protein